MYSGGRYHPPSHQHHHANPHRGPGHHHQNSNPSQGPHHSIGGAGVVGPGIPHSGHPQGQHSHHPLTPAQLKMLHARGGFGKGAPSTGNSHHGTHGLGQRNSAFHHFRGMHTDTKSMSQLPTFHVL